MMRKCSPSPPSRTAVRCGDGRGSPRSRFRGQIARGRGQLPSLGLYYVLPYVEGESLRAKLAREGGLPITDAVRVPRDHPRFQALLAKYEN